MRNLMLLAAFLLLAMATRLYHIETQSIWFDEGWSAYAAAQPTLLTAFQADATNPPLYYVALNISARFTGDSEFALRWFSLAIGLLVIPLVYQLTKRLFDERAGLYAAFLAACSPPLWWASQEARMYTLLAALVCITALAWHEINILRLNCKNRLWWLALWVAELALLYSHNTGPVIVFWLNGVTLLAWVVRRSPKSPDWRSWLVGQMLVGLLWLPYFFARFLQVQEANSSLIRRPEIGLPLLSQIWQAFWTSTWALVNQEPLIIVLCVLVFAVFLVILRWREAGTRWMLAHVVILTSGLVLGLSVLGNELHGRYIVMIVPLLLVSSGAGIASLFYSRRRFSVCLLFVGLLLANIHYVTQDKTYQHDDARAMVQYYAETLNAEDTVLAWSYADRYELAYYWDRLGVEAQRVTLPEGADLDVVLPLMPQSGDVALNVWYTQRADFRGMMGCLLSNGTANEPEQYTVYGMTNYVYRAPQLMLPEMRVFDALLSLSGVRVTAAGDFPQFTAERALCLPVQIALSQAVDVDLKAALLVYNELGWEVAHADAVFADASQRLTSEVPPGTVLTAYPLLRLPYGAPPGNYRVELIIYDERVSPSGYDVLSPQGTPGGSRLNLGVWTALPGADWSRVNRSTDLPLHEVQISDDLTLLARSEGTTARNGDVLRLSLLWRGAGELPELTLAAVDGSWEVAVAPLILDHDAVTLDWRTVQIPPEALAGAAELRLPDGRVIATYTIEYLPAVYDAPLFNVPVEIEIPGVGTLVGYSASEFVIGETPTVNLVWQASATTDISYTVFVQLLDTSGQVIAQSDARPANGARPTTGWRPREYISDTHALRFNENAASGTATLIVGMYDAATFIRLTLEDGGDYLTLGEVVVR